MKRIDELEEVLVKKYRGEVSESEKEYDLFSNVVEFFEENGYRSGVEEKKDDSRVEVEFKMWESCEIEKKEVFYKGKEDLKEEVEDEREKILSENMKESREE